VGRIRHDTGPNVERARRSMFPPTAFRQISSRGFWSKPYEPARCGRRPDRLAATKVRSINHLPPESSRGRARPDVRSTSSPPASWKRRNDLLPGLRRGLLLEDPPRRDAAKHRLRPVWFPSRDRFALTARARPTSVRARPPRPIPSPSLLRLAVWPPVYDATQCLSDSRTKTVCAISRLQGLRRRLSIVGGAPRETLLASET